MYKIAIIGPESTGKSELARQLAETFNVPWVPEYARTYIENLRRHYRYRDVCHIARKQMEEQSYFNKNLPETKMVFFDTDLIITKVWFEYCYNRVPVFVTRHLQKKYFDLYLLCEPDIPWEPDSVREHGNDRQFFFEWYRREAELTETPCVIINGLGENRLKNAIEAIYSAMNILALNLFFI